MSDIWRGSNGRSVEVWGHNCFRACRGEDERETFWWGQHWLRCEREFGTQREALFAALEYATSEPEISRLRALASAYQEIG